MSKRKKRPSRKLRAMGEAVEQAIDQGLLRSAATMGQLMMEQILKTDPKIKALMEQLVTQRLERMLRKLSDEVKES